MTSNCVLKRTFQLLLLQSRVCPYHQQNKRFYLNSLRNSVLSPEPSSTTHHATAYFRHIMLRSLLMNHSCLGLPKMSESKLAASDSTSGDTNESKEKPPKPDITAEVKSESSSNTPEDDVASQQSQPPKKTIVSTMKNYIFKRRDYTKKFTENNTITPVQAMTQYMLSPSELENIPQIKVRSPYNVGARLFVYLEKDVERRAIQVHGSLEELARKRKRIKRQFDLKNRRKWFLRLFSRKKDTASSEKKERFAVLKSGAGRVVTYAAFMNGVVCVAKFMCFFNTGSSSMFSESLHSLADTCNQLLLLWGVNESLKKPDPEHPYGKRNMRHIMSLISGVGIFCLGSGVSVYHGVEMLVRGGEAADVATTTSFAILLGSFVLESTSLYLALNETRKNAVKHNLPLFQYVKEAGDPSTNVVLLEDSAAVLGIGVAASALTLSYYSGSVVYDAVGSILIGGVLGTLASFIVATNINFLVGRSIPTNRLNALQEQLEDDVVVRGVYDVKATMTSADEFKFKAEIDFDGVEITRAYLTKLDRQQVRREFQAIKSLEELDQLLLHHGEQVIDELGAQVDRLEGELKRKNPDLRHIDLEVL